MAQGSAALDNAAEILSSTYPDPATITSTVDAGLWMALVEQLESRLILAATMHGDAWIDGPRTSGFGRDNSSTMNKNALTQVRLFLEEHIVDCASRKPKHAPHFPFKEALASLVEFKGQLVSDPAFRVLFRETAGALRDGRMATLPKTAVFPEDSNKRLAWYKHSGFYSAVLQLVDFNIPHLKEKIFDPAWFSKDESLVVLMCAFSFKKQQTQVRLPRILLESDQLATMHPSLKSIFGAMKAFI